MRALVFGHYSEIMAPVATLLSRAGFRVDVISHETAMKPIIADSESLFSPIAEPMSDFVGHRQLRDKE